MASFDLAFPIVINEEKLVITDTIGDLGGLSIAGISIVNWSSDPIFEFAKNLGLKAGQWNDSLLPYVKNFYRKNFWNKIFGDRINNQEVANTMFSEALVNGVTAAVKDMQLASGMSENDADGKMGEKTINLINNPNV